MAAPHGFESRSSESSLHAFNPQSRLPFFSLLQGPSKLQLNFLRLTPKTPPMLNMALNLNLRVFFHQVFNSSRLMQDYRQASIIWVHVLTSPALCPYRIAALNVTLGYVAQGLYMATRPWLLKAALPCLTAWITHRL